MTVRVVGNDWSAVPAPAVGAYTPQLPVSVVVPAYQCQDSLDLVLAGLAHQTYPAELLEVVVVDDGSDPPLRLPPLRPARCRLVRPPDGWGRAHARHYGALEAAGEVLHWLDADMLVYPDHVAAHARWHHAVPYAVTLGTKRFVDVAPGGAHWPDPEAVARAWHAGADGPDRLFAGLPSTGHDYIEDHIARTDQLRQADHTAFLTHVGATAAVRRELYEATGGFDPELRTGEDTELGYRLAQAGAVFVPEQAARGWHLGATHMMRAQQELQRYNRPFLADRMPHPRWLRRVGGSAWSVPLVTVVAEVGDAPLEQVRAAVDAVLASDERDLRVELVGPWDKLSDERGSPLADPMREPRLIAATYRGDPRVRLVTEPPATAYPSPYLLTLPVRYGLGRRAIRRLVDHVDRHRLGMVHVRAATAAADDTAADDTAADDAAADDAADGAPPVAGASAAAVDDAQDTVVLWRTAARHRADWVRRDGESYAVAVAQVAGADSLKPQEVGMADLSEVPPDQLAHEPGELAPATGRWVPASVQVAGVRSLAAAAWLVTRLGVDRVRARARSLARRGWRRASARRGEEGAR